jgi:hypothetical protein
MQPWHMPLCACWSREVVTRACARPTVPHGHAPGRHPRRRALAYSRCRCALMNVPRLIQCLLSFTPFLSNSHPFPVESSIAHVSRRGLVHTRPQRQWECGGQPSRRLRRAAVLQYAQHVD